MSSMINYSLPRNDRDRRIERQLGNAASLDLGQPGALMFMALETVSPSARELFLERLAATCDAMGVADEEI